VSRTTHHVETLLAVSAYPEAQINLACAIQHALNRGTLVLVEAPWDGKSC
jgi:hypothetical protein